MSGFTAATIDAMIQAASGASSPNVSFDAGAGSIRTCYGIVRRGSEVQEAASSLRLSGPAVSLCIRDGALDVPAWEGPNEDQAITVDGESFVVRHAGHRLSDGTRRLLIVETRDGS